MEKAPQPGFNRTGVQNSPLCAEGIESYAENRTFLQADAADGRALAAVRSLYIREADRIGSVPLPGSVTGAFTTFATGSLGRKPEVMVDKLGERLAFERSAVRLYQALIDKAGVLLASQADLPFSVDELCRIRDEELDHMHLCASVLEGLGADSSAQTPSANVVGMACSGVMQVLTDPRTTMGHCLGAILMVELIDGASWQLLNRLAEDAGQHDLHVLLEQALRIEEQHARQIQGWLETIVIGEIGETTMEEEAP